MNRIARRTVIVWILIIALTVGVFFFIGELASKGGQWITAPGSPHVYNGGNIDCGYVTDRSGEILLDMTDGRTYADKLAVRKSTLHWVGDRYGYISAPAVAYHADSMVGYSFINGAYSYADGTSAARLTLSAEVQQIALEAMGDRKGTVAVYNYKTGEILCAVSTPNYDPDNVPDIAADTSGKYEGIYMNRFTQTSYIPGSIFKCVTAAAALESISDIEDRTFRCSGAYDLPGGRVTCETAHGETDLRQALAKSCNCAFAQLAEELGGELLSRYVEQFAVTERISFDGITTAEGNFDIAGKEMADIAWSAIGQGNDQINPCAFLTYMGAIAGDGIAAEPHVVGEVSVGRSTTYRAKTVKADRIMTAETARTLREYMRNNVETVYGADHFHGLSVCAKSGTGEVGGGQKPNATFCGFVEDEAYPLAFIAVVENGGYGSAVCVPIISAVLESCMEIMNAE